MRVTLALGDPLLLGIFAILLLSWFACTFAFIRAALRGRWLVWRTPALFASGIVGGIGLAFAATFGDKDPSERWTLVTVIIVATWPFVAAAGAFVGALRRDFHSIRNRHRNPARRSGRA